MSGVTLDRYAACNGHDFEAQHPKLHVLLLAQKDNKLCFSWLISELLLYRNLIALHEILVLARAISLIKSNNLPQVSGGYLSQKRPPVSVEVICHFELVTSVHLNLSLN